MGEFVDVKRNRFNKFLKKLSDIDGFEVDVGGRHQWVIKYIDWERPYPIHFKHGKVKKVYVKEIIKKITQTGKVDEEELKSWLR